MAGALAYLAGLAAAIGLGWWLWNGRRRAGAASAGAQTGLAVAIARCAVVDGAAVAGAADMLVLRLDVRVTNTGAHPAAIRKWTVDALWEGGGAEGRFLIPDAPVALGAEALDMAALFDRAARPIDPQTRVEASCLALFHPAELPVDAPVLIALAAVDCADTRHVARVSLPR